MKDDDKLNELTVGQNILNLETVPEPVSESPKLTAGILRRWYIALLVFILVCGLGLPAIWLMIKPVQVVTGQIRVAPILVDIMTDTRDRGDISDYQSFIKKELQIDKKQNSFHANKNQ